MKKCSKCLYPKPATEFYVRKTKKNGENAMHAQCKNCMRGMVSKGQKQKYKSNTDYRLKKIASNKIWLEGHPGYLASASKKHYENNKDKVKSLSVSRRSSLYKSDKEYRELAISRVYERRAKEKSGERISRNILAKRDNYICHICRNVVTENNWSTDHIIPLSIGGPHTYLNTSIAHKKCNMQRLDKIICSDIATRKIKFLPALRYLKEAV